MPAFADLFAVARRSAVHLEMRDTYTPSDPVFQRWRKGEPIDAAADWGDWLDTVRATAARGVQIRRARVVSEPVTDFIRYEYDLTGPLNIAAGEQVRWLPRRCASDLALPGNDFWLFDGEVVLFNLFDGVGEPATPDEEVSRAPRVVELCDRAFQSVWQRAVPHAEYRLT